MSSRPCRVEQKAPSDVSWRCTVMCVERCSHFLEEDVTANESEIPLMPVSVGNF